MSAEADTESAQSTETPEQSPEHVRDQPNTADRACTKRMFHCHLCKYVTDRKNNLKRHVITMHERCAKSLECCNHVFPNKASLRDHVVAHHQQGYVCSVCGRNFCRKALLKRHVTVHSGQKDYTCEICGYATSHKSNLDRHKRRHLPKDIRYQYYRSMTSFPAFYGPTYAGLPMQTYRNPAQHLPRSLRFHNRCDQFVAITDRNKRKPDGEKSTFGKRLGDEGDKSTATRRPKIWNPAISDEVRYSTKSCESTKLSQTTGHYPSNYGLVKSAGRGETSAVTVPPSVTRKHENTRDVEFNNGQFGPMPYRPRSEKKFETEKTSRFHKLSDEQKHFYGHKNNPKGPFYPLSYNYLTQTACQRSVLTNTHREPGKSTLFGDINYSRKRQVRILQTPFKCHYCNVSFNDQSALSIHNEASHSLRQPHPNINQLPLKTLQKARVGNSYF